MIVDHRRQQSVRARDRVKVSGEVEVDVVHRNDLGVPPAGCAALYAEDGTEAWLPHAHHGVDSETPERLRDAHRDGALPFSRGGWVDPRHEHEPSARWSR